MNPFFVERLAMYAAYHRDPVNHVIHVVGVPVIFLGTLIPFSRLALLDLGPYTVSGATLITAALTAMYVRFDRGLGLATGLCGVLLLLLAERIAEGGQAALAFAALCFVGGWISQFVGHGLEGRKPALLDNAFLTFMAPVYLVAGGLNALGLKRGLHAEIEARWPKYRHGPGLAPAAPAAGEAG